MLKRVQHDEVEPLNSLTITPANPTDAPALKALLEAAYRGNSARAGWNHEADILDDERIAPGELEAMLAEPAVTILTARESERLIGGVAVTRKDARRGYRGMRRGVPTRQSGGLARRLLDAAQALAREGGIAAMEMTVIDSRGTLIAWYERRGYARTGETRPFPVPRDPPIAFVVLEKRLATA